MWKTEAFRAEILRTEIPLIETSMVTTHTCTRPRQAGSYQAIKVPIAAVRDPAIEGGSDHASAFFDAT
jgi:hypothetical protein